MLVCWTVGCIVGWPQRSTTRTVEDSEIPLDVGAPFLDFSMKKLGQVVSRLQEFKFKALFTFKDLCQLCRKFKYPIHKTSKKLAKNETLHSKLSLFFT